MYGLMMAVGFLLCSVICFLRTRKRGLQGENLIIIAAMLLLFALIGGFVFYALVTYSPVQIADFIREGDWESLLGGGIVFYGALIGGIIGAFIGSVIAKDDLRDYMDIIVPVIPLGHAIGRIGCFFAGCCYGRQIPGTQLRWPTREAELVYYVIILSCFLYRSEPVYRRAGSVGVHAHHHIGRQQGTVLRRLLRRRHHRLKRRKRRSAGPAPWFAAGNDLAQRRPAAELSPVLGSRESPRQETLRHRRRYDEFPV